MSRSSFRTLYGPGEQFGVNLSRRESETPERAYTVYRIGGTMKTALAVFCTVAALGLTACGQADNRQADAQALKDNEAQWNRDYASKDLEKVLAHYADNAVLIAPGTPAVSGKDAIRKELAGMIADPALSLQFQASDVQVAKSGDIAYTRGSYQMTLPVPSSKRIVHDHGSYVTTYSKQPDGSWKAVADIASSEVAPGTPPSAAPSK